MSKDKPKTKKVYATISEMELAMLNYILEKEGYSSISNYFSHILRNDFNSKYKIEQLVNILNSEDTD